MGQARRLARWLRLVVTCLAFVITAAPAVAAPAFDEIVLVANERAPVEIATEIGSVEAPSGVVITVPSEPSIETVVLVSRRYIANCALLL
jgi:hypothetical protein